MIVALLSQVAVDPNNAWAAGWGAFGLSGMILCWLFFKHLPAKDAQLTQFVQEKDKLNLERAVAHDKHIGELVLAFSKEQQLEREHCARLHAEQMAEHRATHAEQTATRHEVRNLLNQLILKGAVEEAMKKTEAKQGG